MPDPKKTEKALEASKPPALVKVRIKRTTRLKTMALGLPGPDVSRWFGDGQVIEMSPAAFEYVKATCAPSTYEVVKE